MSRIIAFGENGPAIVADEVAVIRDEDALPAQGVVLVSLKRWLNDKAGLEARATAGELGVYLLPDDEPALLADSVAVLRRIACDFPLTKFGQGYSTAVLLRTRYGYAGRLRAFGDIWRDQMFYLRRVGFDEFVVKAGKSLDDALLGFDDFTVTYQNSADEPLPLFKRRVA
ncbi:MAG: DUF934 domain-containing protein [Burkholderiaceae bacterium]